MLWLGLCGLPKEGLGTVFSGHTTQEALGSALEQGRRQFKGPLGCHCCMSLFSFFAWFVEATLAQGFWFVQSDAR